MSYEPPLTGRLVVVVERSASPPSRAPSRLRRGTTEPRIPRLSRPSMACRRNDNVWSSSQRRRGRHRAVALLARALVSGPDPTLSSSDAPRWTPPTPALTSRDDGMRLYRIRSSLDASPILRLGVSPARRAPPRGARLPRRVPGSRRAGGSHDGCPGSRRARRIPDPERAAGRQKAARSLLVCHMFFGCARSLPAGAREDHRTVEVLRRCRGRSATGTVQDCAREATAPGRRVREGARSSRR
jgi:hypothetical protein